MGLSERRIYLDSCIVIYIVEEHPMFAPIVEQHLADNAEVRFVVSALTEMECLVMPLRKRNQQVTDKFHNWFMQVETVTLEREVLLRAADLRARHAKLKTPDAIHLAAAQHHGCAEFWTNDNRLDHIAPNLIKKVV